MSRIVLLSTTALLVVAAGGLGAWAADSDRTCKVQPAAAKTITVGMSERAALQALGCDSASQIKTESFQLHRFPMADGSRFFLGVTRGRVDFVNVLPGE